MRQRTKRTYIVIIIALFILFFTNPDHEKHKWKIQSVFKQEHPIIGTLGGGRLAGSFSEYQDYFLFSTTKIDENLVSFGILNKVFILRKLDLDLEK